jgi:hypothetical protein
MCLFVLGECNSDRYVHRGMDSALRVCTVLVCVAPLLLTHCTLTEDLDPNWLAEHAAAGEAGEAGEAGAASEAGEGGEAGARVAAEVAGAGGVSAE